MKTNIERTEIFKELKALFEFDENGILPLLAPGMSGPIDFPLGYLDMTKIHEKKGDFQGYLLIQWANKEDAQIVSVSNSHREATTEEMYYALKYYKEYVVTYRQEEIKKYNQKGQEIPKYMQARLGMIPYFANK